MEFAVKASPIHGDPTLLLKVSAANIFVTDSTGHLQRSCEVHALTCQNYFGGQRVTHAVLKSIVVMQ